MVTTWSDIARRAEAAEGADALDGAVAEILARTHPEIVYNAKAYLIRHEGWAGSVDECLRLVAKVLPRWEFDIESHPTSNGRLGYACLRGPNFSDLDMTEYANSGDRALPLPYACLAAIARAMDAKEPAPHRFKQTRPLV